MEVRAGQVDAKEVPEAVNGPSHELADIVIATVPIADPEVYSLA